MITESMTIHEALSELKMLDKRIRQKIDRAVFCVTNKHSNSKINGKSIADFKADMVAENESINALIHRRSAIRNALSVSNAQTMISVGCKEYTVAEAIEMKTSGIENYELLLKAMSRQFTQSTLLLANDNGDRLREKADNYLVSMFGGKDRTANNDDIESARRQYMENNVLDLIDPINVSKEIENLESFIEKFKAEVDSKLSISNATTIIEVSY